MIERRCEVCFSDISQKLSVFEKSGIWLNQEQIQNMNEPDRSAFQDTKVMYQTRKGNHLVSFLVPADTMDKLCDKNVCNDCGVLNSNHYLFLSTINSTEHVYTKSHRQLGLRDVIL